MLTSRNNYIEFKMHGDQEFEKQFLYTITSVFQFTWEQPEVCQTSWWFDQFGESSMQACHQKSLRACALTENASSQDQPGFGDQHRALCEMLQQLQLTGTLEGWPHLNGVTLSPSWVILSVDWILVYDQNCSPFPFICDNQKVQINSNANTPTISE